VTKKETTRQIHHETLKDGNKKIKEKEFWLIIWELANIVLYAYHGIKNNSNRKDAILRNLPYLGIAGVGIGSAIFHATLKNYTQWCKLILSSTAGSLRISVFGYTSLRELVADVSASSSSS